jgi:hypothetical protein
MADIYQQGTIYSVGRIGNDVYLPLTAGMQEILQLEKGLITGGDDWDSYVGRVPTYDAYAKTLREKFERAIENGEVEPPEGPEDCEESWSIGFEIAEGDRYYLFDEDGHFGDHEAWLLQQFLLGIDRKEARAIVYEYGATPTKLRPGYAYGGICVITREDIIWESTRSMEMQWLGRLGYGAPAWNDNFVQFARLLSEINATQEIDLPALAVSMDLQVGDVTSLLDRADAAWEKIKGNHHI